MLVMVLLFDDEIDIESKGGSSVRSSITSSLRVKKLGGRVISKKIDSLMLEEDVADEDDD